MTEIYLSSMWSKNNYRNIEDFVADAHRWGFAGIELSSALSKEAFDEILKVKGVKVSSIHSPCSPMSLAEKASPDNPPLSSLDKDERQKAISYAQSTIEFASQVGVKVIVLHCGFVPLDLKIDFEEKLHRLSTVDLSLLKENLYRLYNESQFRSKKYIELKEKVEKERSLKAKPYFEAAKASLDKLTNFALKREMKLGIETRDSFHEIPQIEEMAKLLKEFEGSSIGYWHDVGHAERTSRLDFAPHREWFLRFKDKMIGVHLHDIRKLQDHYLPGLGNMDWDLIGENLPEGIIKVCEAGEWNNKGKIKEVIPFLEKKGIA
jgi:sugar phosphate isomerase/epimerase